MFCHNRDRLLTHEVAETFFEQIKVQASAGELLSKEHFTADSTLLDAAASIKSFMRKGAESGEGAKSDEQKPGDQGRNKEVNFHGEQYGESQRSDRTGQRKSGNGNGGAGSGFSDAGCGAKRRQTHLGCRQELRHPSLCGGLSQTQSNAAYGTEKTYSD